MTFLSLFIFASFLDFSKKHLSHFFYYFLFFITLIFTGFRYYTGNDWYGYINYFNTVDISDNTYEFGFKIINLFFKSIWNNYYLVQIFASFLICFSIFKFYSNNAKYRFLALLLYIVAYFQSLFMSQVRQSIAVALIIVGSKYIFNRKFIKYLIIVLIASLFHISAILAIFLYFLFLPTKRYIKFFMIFISFIFLLKPDLINLILSCFSSFLPGRLGKLLNTYVLSNMFNLKTDLGSGLYFYAKIFLMVFIVIFYKPKTLFDHFVINCLLVSNVITNMSLGFSYISRLECYFGFASILGWLKILEIKWIKNYKDIFFIVYFMLIIFFSIPYISARTATGKNRWGQPMQYTYIPYYNLFFHPENANERKDWCE